jgi:hypothetical protein
VRSLPILRETTYEAVQLFADFAELEAKLRILGEPALTRIQKLRGQTGLEIRMPYGMALVASVIP